VMSKYYLPFCKTSYPNEKVNRTDPSLSVSVPCFTTRLRMRR
jgi:hypothetical protein